MLTEEKQLRIEVRKKRGSALGGPVELARILANTNKGVSENSLKIA